MSENSAQFNRLLDQHREGQPAAFEKLMSLVYNDLRKLAAWQLQSERSDHTLQPTALVHEAYLKLQGLRPVEWRDKAHFFALAAQVMRHILVDYARTRHREKRGGGQIKLSLDEVINLEDAAQPELVALDQALRSLAEKDERKSRIVELRYFGGLSIEETADLLSISPTTVRREWTLAKAWLRREMK